MSMLVCAEYLNLSVGHHLEHFSQSSVSHHCPRPLKMRTCNLAIYITHGQPSSTDAVIRDISFGRISCPPARFWIPLCIVNGHLKSPTSAFYSPNSRRTLLRTLSFSGS